MQIQHFKKKNILIESGSIHFKIGLIVTGMAPKEEGKIKSKSHS